MNRFTATTAGVALALAGTATLPTPALAEPGGSSEVARMCNSGLADALGMSVGTCIQLLRDGDAVGICKFLKDADLLDLSGYRNQGQCIRALS